MLMEEITQIQLDIYELFFTDILSICLFNAVTRVNIGSWCISSSLLIDNFHLTLTFTLTIVPNWLFFLFSSLLSMRFLSDASNH